MKRKFKKKLEEEYKIKFEEKEQEINLLLEKNKVIEEKSKVVEEDNRIFMLNFKNKFVYQRSTTQLQEVSIFTVPRNFEEDSTELPKKFKKNLTKFRNNLQALKDNSDDKLPEIIKNIKKC